MKVVGNGDMFSLLCIIPEVSNGRRIAEKS